MVADVKKTLVFLVVLLSTTACYFGDVYLAQYPRSLYSNQDIEYYSIEPETFLGDLGRGNLNGLTPLPATSEPPSTPPEANKSFMWTYQEYVYITDILAKSLWVDDLDEWKLLSMDFHVDCQDPLTGFTYGNFKYFKETEEAGESVYSVREIQISSLFAEVAVGSGSTYPKDFFGWKNIDTNKMIATANDALQTAESIGGSEFRNSVNDECQVYLTFSPNASYNGWIVSYNSLNKKFFKVRVNSYNGRYKIEK